MFDIYKTIDLSDLGEKWEGCYLKFNDFSMGDVSRFAALTADKDGEESSKIVLEILESKFVEGYAMKDGMKVAVAKEELKEFPPSVLTKAVSLFTEDELSKKKSNPSMTASEE